MVEQSQSTFRNGVAAGVFHHPQCSAAQTVIWAKLLILCGEVVVTRKKEEWVSRGRKGVTCPLNQTVLVWAASVLRVWVGQKPEVTQQRAVLPTKLPDQRHDDAHRS